MKNLYKTSKYELNISENEKNNIELKIYGIPYLVFSHYYEPHTYIQTPDKSVNIAIQGAYDFGILFENHNWNCSQISLIDFCEKIESAILKDRVMKKQQIVKKTGYKTAVRF